MTYGYLFSSDPLELADARAVIKFTAGPWRFLTALNDLTLPEIQGNVDAAHEQSDDLIDLILGLPPIPVPRAPKVIVPPDDSLVAIILAHVRPGAVRTFKASLDGDIVSGALSLLTPYARVLLDVTADDEDTLMRQLDETLDSPHVISARVGIARGSDVTYLGAAPEALI